MLKRKPGNNKAQSVLEYALAIVCVVAALLAMQNYIPRGIQGKLRQSADELGQLYAPGNTTGNSSLVYIRDSVTEIKTLSERELTQGFLDEWDRRARYDLNENEIIEPDVFGTTTNITMRRVGTAQNGTETVRIWK